MNKFTLTILTILALAPAAFADDAAKTNPGTAAYGERTVNATVTAIDHKTRQVTLKGEDGKEVSFKVGPIARNLDQVKTGDKVTFKYQEALVIDVRKATGPIDETSEVSIDRAPKGEKPAGQIAETYTLKALVENIDYTTRHVTLKGPKGNSLTFQVSDKATRFNEVKQGDHVVVQYTEALGVSVTTPQG